MAKQLQLTISTPCHENWEVMTQSEKGKYCGSCQKQVIDFSNMSDRQVAQFFKKPSTGSICGRFMTDQLDRAIEIPKKRIPWLKYFFQFALPAFFISKAGAQNKTLGTVARPISKDTVQRPIRKEPEIMGKVKNPNCIRPVMGDTINLEMVGGVSVVIPEIKGRVVDESGEPIAFASIQTGLPDYFVIADEMGRFSIQISTLTKERKLHISSTGFESKDTMVGKTNEDMIVQLKANIVLPEVIITTYGAVRVMGGISAGIMIKNNQAEKDSLKAVNTIIPDRPSVAALHVYPNPVPSGSPINISFKESVEEGYYSLEMVSLSGQKMKQEEIWIDADARILNIEVRTVAAGTYFLILSNKKTGKKYSEKIVVQ